MNAKNPVKIGILTSGLHAIFVKQAWKGFELAIKDTAYELELFETQPATKVEENVFIKSIAFDKDIAGVVFLAMPMSISQMRAFKEQGIPLVNMTSRTEGLDWVMVDDLAGTYIATKHLLNLGHRRLGLINGPAVALTSRLREEGFLRALKEAGVTFGRDSGIEILNYEKSEGYDAATMLMGLPARPTGLVVAAGDITALGVLEALKDSDIRVPGDVSVVGYDNLEFSANTEPPLTTFAQPLEEMGRIAIEKLIDAIEMGNAHRPEGEIVSGTLVVRESTAKPPS